MADQFQQYQPYQQQQTFQQQQQHEFEDQQQQQDPFQQQEQIIDQNSPNQNQDEQQQYYQNNESDTQAMQFEDDIARLLQTIIQLESAIEEQRQQLADNDKFCTNEAFKYIDQGGHGFITANDLKVFFSNNHIAVHEHECDFLIYECTNKAQQLTFSDFMKIILPRQDLNLREQCLLRRKPQIAGRQNELPFYLEEQLAKLLESEINYIRETEAQKIDLLNKYTLNFRDAFNIITREYDYINSKIMYQFMSQKHENYEEQYYVYLEERLDKDKSKTLTIDEFCNAIFPSDFIQRPPQPARQTKTFEELVRGDESQFLNYLQRKPKPAQPTSISKYASQSSNFQPEKYKFENNVNFVKFNSDQNKNGTLRKFLRTNLQFEKNFNLSPAQNNFHQYFQNTTDAEENEVPQSPYRQNLIGNHGAAINLQNGENQRFTTNNQQEYQQIRQTNRFEDDDIVHTSGNSNQQQGANQPRSNYYQHTPSPSNGNRMPFQQQQQYQKFQQQQQQMFQQQQQRLQLQQQQQQLNGHYESQTSSNEDRNQIYLNNPVQQHQYQQYNPNLIPENQSYNYR